MSDFDKVGDFHIKFGLPATGPVTTPREISPEVAEFRLRFLLEELYEIAAGYGFSFDPQLISTNIGNDSPCAKCGYENPDHPQLLADVDVLDLVNAHHCVRQSLPDIADGLIDLVYVALGTAHLHGFPWDALFDEVQRANMSKVRATHAEQSRRKSTLDVVKPEGFQPPDIVGVLLANGWQGPQLPLPWGD